MDPLFYCPPLHPYRHTSPDSNPPISSQTEQGLEGLIYGMPTSDHHHDSTYQPPLSLPRNQESEPTLSPIST